MGNSIDQLVEKYVNVRVLEERAACARLLDNEADRLEKEWKEYLDGEHEQKNATSYHALPKLYAQMIRDRK